MIKDRNFIETKLKSHIFEFKKEDFWNDYYWFNKINLAFLLFFWTFSDGYQSSPDILCRVLIRKIV